MVSKPSDREYANHAAKRTPVCFCLDVSGSVSMSMGILNNHVASLYKTIAENQNPFVVFDIATVTFGGMAGSPVPGVQMKNFNELNVKDTPPRFDADEKSPLGKAVNDSLELLEEYKYQIKNIRGMNYYQPILIIISDGQVNDERDKVILERVQTKIRRLASEDKLIVIPIGIGRVNPNVMNKFSPNGKYFQSTKIDFSDIVKLLVSTAVSGAEELPGRNIRKVLETMHTTSKEDLK